MTSSIGKFSHLRIPLEEISSATDNFADENLIGRGAFGNVYKGRLWRSQQWINISVRRLDRRYGLGDIEFWAEISRLSSLNHRNIVSIIGFCDEKEVKIIVNKHETKGSLQGFLTGSIPALTWTQRLRICVGVASALRYLHNSCVVHHNINVCTVLLDKNREAKLSGFEFSIKNPSTRDDRVLLTQFCGTRGYEDPEYEKTGGVTYKSDVFSFGVVLFELLCGSKAFIHDDRGIFVAPVARLQYEKNKAHEIVDPDLWKDMDPQSFMVFSEIAYSCLTEQRADRPSMDEILSKLEKAYHLQVKHEKMEQSGFVSGAQPTSSKSSYWKVPLTSKEQSAFVFAAQPTSPKSNYWKEKHLEHLKIELKDILLATDNFSYTYCIRSTVYAMVYKAKVDYVDTSSFSIIERKNIGEVLPKRKGYVSIKRLIETDGKDQGKKFLTEIEMLSRCKHRNIVSLLGFCDEDNEMIIIYEHASKGSLFDYLGGTSNLPWGLRLKICLDIARGLNYLHTSTEGKEMIIHCNITTPNILLGNNREAKISDFGLSRILPSKQQDNSLYPDEIAHTNTYTEGRVDTYSFGVVLFEILCGRTAEDPIYRHENKKGLTYIARECFENGTLKEIVDPKIKEEIDTNMFNLNKGTNQDSLYMLSKVAYQCVTESQLSMEALIKILEKALHLQENCIISLEDIKLATKTFNRDNLIGGGGSALVYKGEVQHINGCKTIVAKQLQRSHNGQGKHQFLTERQILLEYKHESIVALVAYCDEMDENIIVYEHMSNGSLDRHLKNLSLTWKKRLQICIDVASALNFLHQGGATQEVVIHRDIKSANILLDIDWKAKLADFGLSLISSLDKEEDFVVNHVCGTRGYWDPLYRKTGLLTKESDMYSFGVVLFEILSGRLVYIMENGKFLTMFIKHSYQEGKLDEVVFEGIKEQISPISLTIFQKIAYQCIHDEREKRPTAREVVRQLKIALEFQENENLKISLEDIKSATQDFNAENCIGGGCFGKVYKGEHPQIGGHNVIAIKRLHESCDREHDFLTELEFLLEYKHENIIRLVGYFEETDEKLIVYEHASRGSLGKHLKDNRLTWIKRLEICIDIASGLDFIHGGSEAEEGVIHRDIKSSNVLLFDDWKAKITGFRLSLVSSINKEMKSTNNHVCSTLGYCDPLYHESGSPTRNSDIYSLGVVFFEILSGKFAYENDNDEPLTRLVKLCLEEGKPDKIVFDGIKDQIAQQSLITFETIANQCLHDEREKRPTASEVVRQLKKALKFQGKHLKHLKIPLEDIVLATSNFSNKYCIASSQLFMVYKGVLNHFDHIPFSDENKGELPKRTSKVFIKRIYNTGNGRGEEAFFAEIENLSSCDHPNIDTLLGFCIEGTEVIIVYDYASGWSLHDYLEQNEHLSNLPWRKRLRMCLDIAHGLDYLHSSSEDNEKHIIIHRGIASRNIRLGSNWKPKITNFGDSIILPPNQDENALYLNECSGEVGYVDPEYSKTCKLSRASDIYSFGVVLFEILFGRVAHDPIYGGRGIAFIACQYFKEGTLKEMVDISVMEEFDLKRFNLNKGCDQDSLETFSKIAYQCLAENQDDRPTIQVIIKELEKALHFHANHTITFLEINSATRNFSDENCIRKGGFGKIYKGEHENGTNFLAKRLDGSRCEWKQEYLTERDVLLKYKHENIIGLIGFYAKRDEHIVLYEHMSNGCLYMHLTNFGLAWTKRLEICIDIARGLDFLHRGGVTEEVVIHRNICSRNILLDGDWKAKIVGFEFSWMKSSTNKDKPAFITKNTYGIEGYCDPLYRKYGLLSVETDIYSLGVVLFEILSGRFAGVATEPLTSLVEHCFEEGEFDEIVLQDIKKKSCRESLSMFLILANRCLHDDRAKRPSAGEVLQQLKQALKFQENHERRLRRKKKSETSMK